MFPTPWTSPQRSFNWLDPNDSLAAWAVMSHKNVPLQSGHRGIGCCSCAACRVRCLALKRRLSLPQPVPEGLRACISSRTHMSLPYRACLLIPKLEQQVIVSENQCYRNPPWKTKGLLQTKTCKWDSVMVCSKTQKCWLVDFFKPENLRNWTVLTSAVHKLKWEQIQRRLAWPLVQG